MEPPPNHHENLKFLECENAKKDGKRTFHTVTIRNKSLK